MKRCPECHREYSDEGLNFCLDDGEWLVDSAEPHAGSTEILRSTDLSSEAPTRTIIPTDTSSPSRDDRVPNRGAIIAGVLGILLVTALGAGYWYYSRDASSQINSIAVLPFENASGNADLDYLSDGVSESLIDRLSQLPQLKVIARTSSFQYRAHSPNIQDIAKTLGVEALVTGRISQRGDSYSIRVEVIDARENRNLWSESFIRRASDVQALQAELSREIAENLRLRLSGAQTQQLAGQVTTNPQAYELLLKGRFFFNKGGRDYFDKAVEYYEQATVLDPNYALAFAELSEGYNYNGGRGLDQKQIAAKQEETAKRALELDPNLAEAHYAMAESKRRLWQWQESELEYLRAIELNPNLPRVYRGYSVYLSLMRQHDQAIAYAKRARDLDPLSITVTGNLGGRLYAARRFDESITAWRQVAELTPEAPPPHFWLGNVYAAKGMYLEAIAEFQEAVNKTAAQGSPAPTEALIGVMYARMGQRGKAEEILKKVQSSPRESIPPNLASFHERNLALLYDALGRRDEAIAQLEKAFADRISNLPLIKVDPAFDDMRNDPRFSDLERRMGLSP